MLNMYDAPWRFTVAIPKPVGYAGNLEASHVVTIEITTTEAEKVAGWLASDAIGSCSVTVSFKKRGL